MLSHAELLSRGEVEPGRAVVEKWPVPGQPGVLVGSVYLKTGVGLGSENLEILNKIGEVAARAGLQVVIGGGYKVDPTELCKCDCPQKTRRAIVAPGGATLRMGPCQESRVEFLVVDIHLAKAVQEVRPREEWHSTCTGPWSGQRS